MFRRLFIRKLLILSISMILAGFFIGYSYSIMTGSSLKASSFKEAGGMGKQYLHFTPTPVDIKVTGEDQNDAEN